MIMIWNRREVFVSNSLQKFNDVRNKISAQGIKYDYKVVDSSSSTFFGPSRRGRTGSFGVNTNYTKTYYLYVHKNDYGKAQALLRN